MAQSQRALFETILNKIFLKCDIEIAIKRQTSLPVCTNIILSKLLLFISHYSAFIIERPVIFAERQLYHTSHNVLIT